jgi:CRISPR-associated exonuclease Cas4
MNEKEIDALLRKFKMARDELDNVRKSYPKINLYDKPVIGTEEVRQYVYCKRIPFFRHVLKAPMKQTYKMEYGTKKHEKLEKLSHKSKESSQKYYNVYLTDPDIGLVGLIDYFEYDGNEAYPVEFKSGNMPPDGITNPHKYQVAAQALLIEKAFKFLVKKVRIYYVKHEEFIDYEIEIEDKLEMMRIVKEIQDMIISEIMPEPTRHLGKCRDCECKIYCSRA